MATHHRGAIVLGGSDGIGAGTAVALARAGRDVVAVGRSTDKLAALAERARALSLPGRVSYSTSDVADHDALVRTLDEAATLLAGVDLLVHSIATPRTHGPTRDLEPAMVYEACAAMVASAVIATGWAQRTMAGQPDGKVLLLSSGAGDRPSPYRGIYSLTKAALEQFARCACVEPEVAAGPAVTVVYPGFVETSLQEDIRRLAGAPDEGTRAVFTDLVARLEGATLTADESGAMVAELATYPADELACALYRQREGLWERTTLG